MSEYRHRFAQPAACLEQCADGSAILRNGMALPELSETVLDRLDHWVAQQPETIFLSEVDGEQRQHTTYAEFARITYDVKHMLGVMGLKRGDRIALLAENSIAHAAWVMGAMRAGIVPAIISSSLIRSEEGRGRLVAMLAVVGPKAILIDSTISAADIHYDQCPILPLALPETGAGAAGAAEEWRPTLDDTAKILFTSGSTGNSKAVPNTHRMMASNMVAVQTLWPFLKERPPVMVDWLPWSHTFGGNCCFNLALWNGGTFHIDAGRPLPSHVDTTWQAIKELQPTVYFNVPVGYAMLTEKMAADPAGAAEFFGSVEFLFNAGAALPASVREGLENIAQENAGRTPPIIGAWGATETAPFSTALYFPVNHPANLGLPIPGTEVKMVPSGGVTELRVRGPNVFSHYLGDEQSSADAFDEEGFYRIGDAAYLVDEKDPAQGIVFDGRVAENFKLSSGTWVNVGPLRLALVSACTPHVRDIVILGEGRREISLLLFDPAGSEQGAGRDAAVAAALAAHNAQQLGSSTRVARFAWAETPPQPGQEITDKGYINQRAVIRNRADEVERACTTGITVA